jgi:hypothetical protein
MNNPVYGNRIIHKPSSVPNVLKSKEVFTVYVEGKATQYRSYVDLNSKRWYVRNELDMSIVLEGVGTSKHKLLIHSKNALKSLGVRFNTETREKRKKDGVPNESQES